jgi:PKD repeat protein
MTLRLKKAVIPFYSLLIITLAGSIIPKLTSAQAVSKNDTASFPYWISMMQDPEINFHSVQHAFDLYWKDRPVTRSSGWKPFKRWEYMTGLRANPDGSRPAADKDKNEYYRYFKGDRNITDDNSQWTELGPVYLPVNAPGLGRLNAVAFHPTDENVIYVGAPSGGLWKTVDGGQLWTSNTDNLPTLGVSAVIVDYSNPDILYIGTGDRDAGDAPGLGVMKSVDGGNTWASINSVMGNVTVNKMLIHPVNPLLLYAATSNGIFKTFDGGQNWVYTSPSAGSFKDIVFKPGNPDVLYAAKGGLLFRSTDAGANWTALTNGIPGGYRGCIGVTPANPEIVYFLIGNSDSYRGMYFSTDGGDTFTEQSTSPNILSWGCNGGSGGQSWYDLCVAVDPVDPNIVFVGGVNIFKSTDAGQTWMICAHWYGDCGVAFVHADQHVFEWNPLNNRLYAGCDGGCFYTADGGSEWIMVSQGLAIAQVYKIGQSATVKDLVINGYQDNGTAVFNDTNWVNVLGADGMECAIDPVYPLYKYGTYYYGALHRIYGFDHNGNIGGNGVNGITEEGAWVSPFIIHETDPNTIFLGLKSVWRSNNVRTLNANQVHWTKISGNFGSGNCRALEQSPANPDILYLIKESGKLVRTDNANSANPTWVDLTANLPSGLSGLSDIEAHPTKADWAYACCTGKVVKTTDRGLTWTDISGTLPDVFYSSVLYCKGSQEGIYVSSDIGVFYKDASLSDWAAFSNGLPPASRVTELDIYYDQGNPSNNRLRGCTYGRGLWESPLYQSQPQAAFTSDYTGVPVSCPVNFTDLSFGFPTSWLWTFQGGTPATANVQNPGDIQYSAPGVYDVTLVISNAVGSDTLVMPGYITVSPTILPSPGFSVVDSILCSSPQVVTFTDTTHYCPSAWTWTFSPNTITFLDGTNANSQNPVVQFNEDGQYSVTLTVGNVNGSISLTQPDFIMVGGKPLPFSDDFEAGPLSTKAWTIENPDNDNTWESWATGGNPPGILSARVKIFGTNTMGRRDRLISPVLNFDGIDHPGLYFKHAYAQYQTDYSDTLIVLISEDCGASWTRLYTGYDDGTGTFATHPPQTSNFIPSTANDWCGNNFGSPCLSFDLSTYGNKKNIKIAFETVSFISNNIYIDDVNISSTQGINDQVEAEGVILYPNPANDKLFIESKARTKEIIISNIMGASVLQKEVRDQHLSVDISNLNPGMYSVKVQTDNGFHVNKIQIIR